MKACGRCPHEKHLGWECGIILDQEKGSRCGCNEAKRAAVLKLRELSGVLIGIFGPPPPSLVQRVRDIEVVAENAIMEIPGRVKNGGS
jgi:hypothetical protein